MPLLPKTRAAALFVAALAGLGASSGCSFVIESRDTQCESDEDCTGFDGATCEEGVCVPRESTSGSTGGSTSASTSASSTTSTGTGGCEGPDGCFSCEPTTQVEYLNACTDAECVPYDNAQLEGLLLEDGSVPPVP